MVRKGNNAPGMMRRKSSSSKKDWNDVLDKFSKKYSNDMYVKNSNYPGRKNIVKLKDLFRGQRGESNYYSKKMMNYPKKTDHEVVMNEEKHHHHHHHGYKTKTNNPYGENV